MVNDTISNGKLLEEEAKSPSYDSGINTVTEDAQDDPNEFSSVRQAVILGIFCLALFVDAFMTGAMIICLDSVKIEYLHRTLVLLLIFSTSRFARSSMHLLR